MQHDEMTMQEILDDLSWYQSDDTEQLLFEACLDSPEGVDYVNFCAWQATTHSTEKGYSYA